jgi:hypothetical protein
MSTPSTKQTQFIQQLVGERQQALAGEFGYLLQHPLDTSKDASALISALLAVPTDPRPVDVTGALAIDALTGNLANLSPRDRTFAQSLIDQWSTKGRLSERQWPHVDRLSQPPVEPKCDPQPGDIVQADGEYYLVVLGKAGRPYAKRLVAGKWEYEAGGMSTARSGLILTGDALAEWASQYGHAYGHCVFCALELTDERSVSVGYGQVCASKRDLPWG